MSFRKPLSLLLLIAGLLAAPVLAFGWRFASIADSRGSDNGVNTAVLSKIVNCINNEKVDLVLVSGDLVDARNSEQLASQLDTWKSVMSQLKCPYYVSVGNHDIPDSNSEDVIRAKFDMPANGPEGCEELVYSFDYKNAHFVCLDSYRRGNHHRLQLWWLRADLARNRKPHTFVFSHDPAFPKGSHKGSSLDVFPSERDVFWRILATHGCQMYFCGHEHLFARDEKDGVVQVVNGTCGAPIHKGIPNTVGKYHYVVVDVDGPSVRCAAKDENGVAFDRWRYSVRGVRH